MPSRLLLLLLALASCSREQAESVPAQRPSGGAETTEDFQGRVFERNIVFLTSRPDSVLLVPWLVTARTLPGGVRREARGLLGRGETWEPFFDEQWETPPTRQPWRILPRGRMRLVVGDEDALEQIIFDEGPRQLEVTLSHRLVEWGGPRGETFRLLDGFLVLSSTRVEGVILDMSRGRPVRDPPGGDWAVLVAGDSLRLILHAPGSEPPGEPGAFSGWALLDGQELAWPDVTATWGETRAFERARREVPVTWSAVSDDDDMRADLTMRAAQVQAGTGDGPQLPVDALFEVEGTVRIDEAVHAVRGLLRHSQP